MNKKDRVYYARIIPQTNTYDVCDLVVRTIEDTYFVGIDTRDKRAYLINLNQLDKTVFYDRKIALEIVLDAEENRKDIFNEELYYEEY